MRFPDFEERDRSRHLPDTRGAQPGLRGHCRSGQPPSPELFQRSDFVSLARVGNPFEVGRCSASEISCS